MTPWCRALRSALVLTMVPLGQAAIAQGRLEVRAGGVVVPSHRSAEFEGVVGTGSGVMPGGEFLLRLRYLGFRGRLLGGTFSADSGVEGGGQVHHGDVGLLAGPRSLAADLGYSRRAFSGTFGDRSWPLARFGVSSSIAIGASGLWAELLMAFYTGLGDDNGSGRGSGRELETRLVYAPVRLPVYAALGYRHERFTLPSGSGARPEEVSGIVLGAGVRFGL